MGNKLCVAISYTLLHGARTNVMYHTHAYMRHTHARTHRQWSILNISGTKLCYPWLRCHKQSWWPIINQRKAGYDKSTKTDMTHTNSASLTSYIWLNKVYGIMVNTVKFLIVYTYLPSAIHQSLLQPKLLSTQYHGFLQQILKLCSQEASHKLKVNLSVYSPGHL